MPWDHIKTGVSKEYLALEWARAQRDSLHRIAASCTDCGLCPEFGVRNIWTGGEGNHVD